MPSVFIEPPTHSSTQLHHNTWAYQIFTHIIKLNNGRRKTLSFYIPNLTSDHSMYKNQIRHIVESIGVLNNNHQTYFYFSLLKQKTDRRQTDRQVLLLKYLRYLKTVSVPYQLSITVQFSQPLPSRWWDSFASIGLP